MLRILRAEPGGAVTVVIDRNGVFGGDDRGEHADAHRKLRLARAAAHVRCSRGIPGRSGGPQVRRGWQAVAFLALALGGAESD